MVPLLLFKYGTLKKDKCVLVGNNYNLNLIKVGIFKCFLYVLLFIEKINLKKSTFNVSKNYEMCHCYQFNTKCKSLFKHFVKIKKADYITLSLNSDFTESRGKWLEIIITYFQFLLLILCFTGSKKYY